MESGYHLWNIYNGVEWNNSYKHLTQSLTPSLWRRSYDYHLKFTHGESMAYGRQETQLKSGESALCQSTNDNSVLWAAWKLIRNQKGRFLTMLWHHFVYFLGFEPMLFFLFCFFIHMKHKRGFQSPKTCLFILRVKCDNEINCSIQSLYQISHRRWIMFVCLSWTRVVITFP